MNGRISANLFLSILYILAYDMSGTAFIIYYLYLTLFL